MNLVAHADFAINAASLEVFSLPLELFEIEGMSSRKVRILLNELCAFRGCRYLEVGAFKGSTILAASYGNSLGSFVTVDNFTQFGGPKETFLKNQALFANRCKFVLLEQNVWDVVQETVAPINVFFYDGNHEEDDQRRAFLHFDSALATEFITVIDDWNFPEVRNGTHDAFDRLRYRVVRGWELYSDRPNDQANWWNGVYIAVVRKPY